MVEYAQRALALLPDTATEELAACYARLGSASRYAGDWEAALEYDQKALQVYDTNGPLDSAAMMRLNVANLLMEQNRYSQSAEYLRDAIRQYAALGAAGKAAGEEAKARLAWVEAQM